MRANLEKSNTYIIKKEGKSQNTKSGTFYIKENTDKYKKSGKNEKKGDISVNIIENTDKYKKSGIKIIKTIELEL